MAKREPKAKAPKAEKTALPRLLRLQHPAVVDMRTAIKADTMREVAPRIAAFFEKTQTWYQECRDDRANQQEFKQGNYVNLNGKCMSLTAYNRAVDSWAEGDHSVEIPPSYQPLLVEYLRETNATCAYLGSASAHDKINGWNTEKYGKWDTDALGEWEPGMYLAGPPRLTHAPYIENLLTNPYEVENAEGGNTPSDIVTIGNKRYVIGTGGNNGSAVFNVNDTETGSSEKIGTYRAATVARRQLSLANVKHLANLVGLIDDHSVVEVRITNDPGNVCFFGAGQVVNWGYLTLNDEQLSPSQIRKLSAEDRPKFTAIETGSQDFRGNAVPWSDMWESIQGLLGAAGLRELRERKGSGDPANRGTPQELAQYNSMVPMRCNPTMLNCLGFRSVQIGVMPFYVTDIEGNQSQGVAIGERSNIHLCVGLRDIQRATAETTGGTTKAKAAKVAKPRAPKVEAAAPKPKATKKAATSKPKTSKPKSTAGGSKKSTRKQSASSDVQEVSVPAEQTETAEQVEETAEATA